MALRQIDAERRHAGIRAETADDRAEWRALKNMRQDLQAVLDQWDAGSNAQKFGWTKDAIRVLRRVLRFV